MPKAKQKKTNPKRVPKTQADVDRAYQQGADFGLEFCLTIVLLTLKDKHDATDEEISRFRREFMDMIESYNAGNFRFREAREALLDDYGIHVNLE